jgi:N-formylmaleamate deformylase
MASTWEQGEHDTGKARIRYRRTGGHGKPALVLVHGFSDDGLCWAPVARELEADYDIVMPDMLGHGLSSRMAPGMEIDMAGDIISLVRGLALERPVLVGHSMGAMACAQAVAREHGLACALALEDPPWFAPGPIPAGAEAGAGEPPIVAWAKTLKDRDGEELFAEYRREHPAWPQELARAMSDAKKRLDQGIIDCLAGALQAGGSSWPAVLGSIEVPLLIVTGDPSLGSIVGPETLSRLRSMRPDAEIAHVAGVGHLIRFDAPEAFLRALRHFLVVTMPRVA